MDDLNVFNRKDVTIFLFGEIVDENVLNAFVDKVKDLMNSNTHFIINLLYVHTLAEEAFEIIETVRFLLMDKRKTLSIIKLNEQIKKNTDFEILKPLSLKANLSNALEFLFDEAHLFPPISFGKVIVSKLVETFLFDFKLLVKKERIFVKEQAPKYKKTEFIGDDTIFHLLLEERFFFVMAFSFSSEVFDLIKTRTDFSLNDFTKKIIKDGISKNPKINFKLEESEGENLFKKEIPEKKFEYRKNPYYLLKDGSTVVIPLSTHLGGIYLEVWIPPGFEDLVIKSIN